MRYMESTLQNQNYEKIYSNRFTDRERKIKARLWKCLVNNYLNRFFKEDMSVLDIGCGYCEFINFIKAKKKYGYDIDPFFESFIGPDVEFLLAQRNSSIPLRDNSIERIFTSNFFEHLYSRSEIVFILKESFRILKGGGKIIIIQPNIELVGYKYWDFFDHIIPLTDKSLIEAMKMVGFRLDYVKRRFLPYATKESKINSDVFLKTYLKFSIFQYVFGKQSLIIGEKTFDR